MVQNIIIFIIEVLVSLLIKISAEYSINITGVRETDHIIFLSLSLIIFVLSIVNLVRRVQFSKRNEKHFKFAVWQQVALYLTLVGVAVGIWFLLTNVYFWIIFGVLAIGMILYYFYNKSFREERKLLLSNIGNAIEDSFEMKVDKLQFTNNANILRVKNLKGVNLDDESYEVVAISNEIKLQEKTFDNVEALYGIELKKTYDNEYFATTRLFYVFVAKVSKKSRLEKFVNYLTL